MAGRKPIDDDRKRKAVTWYMDILMGTMLKNQMTL